MKIKLLIILMLIVIVNINGMESPIEDKLSEVPELVEIVKCPSDELIEVWKLVKGKVISLKAILALKLQENDMSIENKIPGDLIDFKNKINQLYSQIKAVLEYKKCKQLEQRFFFNLINDWQRAKKVFPKSWKKYTDKIRKDSSDERQTVVDGILLEGVRANDADLVNLALTLKANANIEGIFRSDNILAIAVRSGYANITSMLINAGADVQFDLGGGETLLSVALRNGYTNIASLLIDGRANIDARDITGNTCLIIAAKARNKEIVDISLNAGADVNARNDEGSTALMIAAKAGDKEIVLKLLKANADVNTQNKMGNTALMFAAEGLYKEIVEILLQAKADVNAQNKIGNTALMLAVSQDKLALASITNKVIDGLIGIVVQLLINAGADVSIRNHSGKTALMKAKESSADGQNGDIIKLLEQAKMSID